MNPINLFESYNLMYDPDMILTEEYESIDNISDEELLAILEEVIEEEGYTIDESIEYIEEITKAGAQWEVEYRKRRLRKAAACLLYTSPSPRDVEESRMPSSA